MDVWDIDNYKEQVNKKRLQAMNENSSILLKEFDLKQSIAILGFIIGSTGLGLWYMVTEVLK